MVPHAPGPHEAADNALPHLQRFDLRRGSAWTSPPTQKNRVLSLTLYVAVPAAKVPEILNLEAIPRNITGGGNWVALRDSRDSAMKRYWGTSGVCAVLEVLCTAVGVGYYMFNKTLERTQWDSWRFHGEIPVSADALDGTRLNFVMFSLGPAL